MVGRMLIKDHKLYSSEREKSIKIPIVLILEILNKSALLQVLAFF